MPTDTRSLILQTAEFLIRSRGYAAFSYADLAQQLAITKASVHYHFPTKEQLLVVLVDEYLQRFRATLAAIRQEQVDAAGRLRAYAALFAEGFEQGMLPLCGALSAERAALPVSMHGRVHEFFRLHLEWLVGVIEEGRIAGGLRPDTAPDQVALLMLSTLEGGTFVGWAMTERTMALNAFETVLATLLATGAPQPGTTAL